MTEAFRQALLLLLIGFGLGFAFFWLIHRIKKGSFQKLAKEIISKGEMEAESKRAALEIALKQKDYEQKLALEKEAQEHRKKIEREEARLLGREDKLEVRMSAFDKKQAELEKRDATLTLKRDTLDEEKEEVALREKKVQSELEKIVGLTSKEAKEFLLEKIENEVQLDAAHLTTRIRNQAQENADREAARVIATAINRLAVPCVSEHAVTTVSLPNDEMKGRIIGREGRNIRTLEQLTGVNVVIDDTPHAVVLSGFDPIRKHIAKKALKELIQDGRIHPTSIEEAVENARVDVEREIKEMGEDAAVRAGVLNLDPEILKLLGKLHFRYSYGQNVLSHSVEVSHIMGLMAGELGLDTQLARRIGLLHDMGKAVSHEIEGTHALIGYDFAKKYGESEEVANGIGCHHQEITPSTIEGSLCSAADAISGGRPGSRIEAVEQYIKRLRKLETLSTQFHGVEKAYALQAGREIRVVVTPDKIDDAAAVNLARKLAKKIEHELNYPGKIKVTVIREKRAVEYAT